MISVLFLLRFALFYLWQLTIAGEVIYVSDGDTIHVQPLQGERIKVRLEGIDCPEITQPYGLEAKAFVVEAVLHRKVRVRVLDVDKYGRKVARVLYEEKDLSIELLKEGLAWHYKKYNQEPELANLEIEARNSRTGLWSKENVPPWDYRNGTGTSNSMVVTGDEVLVCNSKTSTSYHQGYCRGLRRCQSEVIKISRQSALSQRRKACGYCY